MWPASMMRNSYKPEHAAAITAAGGTIGTLIPPSNSMIMFAVLGWVGMSLFTENRWKLPKLSYALAIVFLIYICVH